MNQSAPLTRSFSPRACLAAIGLKLQELKLFDSISQTVNIPQKIVKHRPAEKLYDAFITILAGARGLNVSGTRLRSDEALPRAFGRSTCAGPLDVDAERAAANHHLTPDRLSSAAHES